MSALFWLKTDSGESAGRRVQAAAGVVSLGRAVLQQLDRPLSRVDEAAIRAREREEADLTVRGVELVQPDDLDAAHPADVVVREVAERRVLSARRHLRHVVVDGDRVALQPIGAALADAGLPEVLAI